MSRSREIEQTVPKILSEFYGISDAIITRVEGGRLSDTFKITITGELSIDSKIKADSPYLFLKISRQIEENTPFSTEVTEKGIELKFPFPKTHPNKDGKLFQIIPTAPGIPSYLQEMTVTLVDYVQPPAPIPDTPYSIHAKFRAMGTYLAQYSRFNEFAEANKHRIPEDPLSPTKIKELIHKTFMLNDGVSPAEIDAKALELSANLTDDDPVTQGFAEGLRAGQLSKMLNKLEELISRDAAIKHGLPKGLINNDIKFNNLFFEINPETGLPAISLAFDLDMVTYGPFVKDLGRTIALNCFNKATGELNSPNMMALINAYHNERPLTNAELKALPHYIELGILASYALRSSYFAERLQGKRAAYDIDRLNPSVHEAELASFAKSKNKFECKEPIIKSKGASNWVSRVCESSSTEKQSKLIAKL